jgi:ribosomal protein S18 acetylase RimI-like enzyme
LVRIRPARPADAGAIADVHVDAWRSAYPGLIPTPVLLRLSKRAQGAEWERQLAERGGADTILVAEQGRDKVIGFGSCGEARATGLPQAGEIFTLYVAPEHQDSGIGRALLVGLFDCLLDSGLNSAVVWVLAGNPARFFYEAMGGRRIAERTENLWNTALPQAAYGWDDLRMVRARRDVREW